MSNIAISGMFTPYYHIQIQQQMSIQLAIGNKMVPGDRLIIVD
jgi:hypothetical protein